MKIKTTLAIATLAFVGTAYGKEDASKPGKTAPTSQSSSTKAASGQEKKQTQGPAADGSTGLKQGRGRF